jgi:HD domain-containing protein
VEHLFRGRLVSFAVLVAASACGPLAILHFFAHQEVQVSSWTHFAFIAFGSLAAATAALILTIVGARRRDGRTVLLGTAFSTMTGILAVHGLATPGVLVGPNGVIAFTGAAVLPVGGAVLALSALPALRRPASVRPLLWLQGILLVTVVTLGVVGMVFPASVPAVPEYRSTPAYVLLVVGLGLFAMLAWRAVRTFTLTRRRADLVVVVGLVWLGLALVPQLLLDFDELGWWIGHGMELVGVVMVGVPVALDVHRGAASRPLTGDLCGTELVCRGGGVSGLERARIAVSPRRQGRLHGAPHRAGSVEVERLVMDHHERLDGSGYPRGLHADALDLETRIMCVCDVHDALISQRVYRDAWSHEAAMTLLQEQSGTAFDPRCVAALQRVLEEEQAAEPVVEFAHIA